jgi:N,N'-diacetyllegionaminate synthase
MVRSIRNIESAFGDGVKRPMKNEEDTRSISRRSLVTTRDIRTGEIISSNDIAIKRPGNGIPPEFKEIIIGMQAKHDISADTVIRWEDFKHA